MSPSETNTERPVNDTMEGTRMSDALTQFLVIMHNLHSLSILQEVLLGVKYYLNEVWHRGNLRQQPHLQNLTPHDLHLT